MICDKENFKLFLDKEMNKILLKINIKDIICINKKPMNIEDKNCISVHYKLKNVSLIQIKELKIRCFRRFDVEEYIRELRKNLSKKFDFFEDNIYDKTEGTMDVDNYMISKEGLERKYLINPLIFYKSMASLDFILNQSCALQFITKLKAVYRADKSYSYVPSYNNINEGSVVSYGDGNFYEETLLKNESALVVKKVTIALTDMGGIANSSKIAVTDKN